MIWIPIGALWLQALQPQVTGGQDKAPSSKLADGAQQPAPAEAPDTHPPAVSGGTPTVTDAAELPAPGWLEFDPGALKDLDRDSMIGTPFTLKVTTNNNRLQYLLGFDGWEGQGGASGFGETYPGIHYLFLTQDKKGFDVAGKILLKIPTSSPSVQGTGRVDYSAFGLVSRDFTKWGLHGDFNVGISSLSRFQSAGYDSQYMVSGSTTSPITGGRWQYTNELVYFSPVAGQDYHLTMMHGISYAAHRYATYSAAIQVGLHGDIPRYQLLFAASFNVGQL